MKPWGSEGPMAPLSTPPRHTVKEPPCGENASSTDIYGRSRGTMSSNDDPPVKTTGLAVEARYITPRDAVLVTGSHERLPGVPFDEAKRLNGLNEKARGGPISEEHMKEKDDFEWLSSEHGTVMKPPLPEQSINAPLATAGPPSTTHPMFPPLPLYGPPTMLRDLQCWMFRCIAFCISGAFLGIITVCAVFTAVPEILRRLGMRLLLKDPDIERPFYEEEKKLWASRRAQHEAWKRCRRDQESAVHDYDKEDQASMGQYFPLDGESDPIICDVGYYARRVGLDSEEFKVQTEDGFIITMWHIYDPAVYTPLTFAERQARGPTTFTGTSRMRSAPPPGQRKYPVLLMHGLLQSSGVYCTSDDASLAFYLCKSGYDVWLGNNRCGFDAEHTSLSYGDPRLWTWSIRQMGVLDLPALVSRVLFETGFDKLGLVAHSQGTSQTFIALAKEQRPELGERLSVFCALAPAVFAGPLLDKWWIKLLRQLSPAMFRVAFGIHAFIPVMTTMHSVLPGRLFGMLAYPVFHFMFGWSDLRWDRGLRDRHFQFAPVLVSAESMRWWLGSEGFAKHTCILTTREELARETGFKDKYDTDPADFQPSPELGGGKDPRRAASAWYDERAPPMALWVAGTDALVDGRRLVQRFAQGCEPHVRLVHSKIIEEYEHLDVVWAMDVIEQVGCEVRDVLWQTCPVKGEVCRPMGCGEGDVRK